MRSVLSTIMPCGLLLRPCCGYSLQTRPSTPAPFAARLLVEDGTTQLHLDLTDFIGLRGRHRSQQALGRVESSISVIAGKGFLVRPLVPHVAQLRNQAAFGKAEG